MFDALRIARAAPHRPHDSLSPVLLPREIVGRVLDMSDGLLQHASHCTVVGKDVHSAFHAEIIAKRSGHPIDMAKCKRVRHRANAAKHERLTEVKPAKTSPSAATSSSPCLPAVFSQLIQENVSIPRRLHAAYAQHYRDKLHTPPTPKFRSSTWLPCGYCIQLLRAARDPGCCPLCFGRRAPIALSDANVLM